MDIAILAYWNPYDGSGWGWGWGGGGGGGGSCPYYCNEGGGNADGSTTVSGDVVLTYAYAGGDAVAMVMSPEGQGPYYAQGVTPVPVGGGAEAPYSITGWAGLGEMAVTGCHDSNYNQLIEADDKCGAFTSEVGVDGNPLDFSGDANFEGDIEIPLGDYGFDLVPFVQLHGTVSIKDQTFDDLPAGSSLYVAALKFQPSLEITAQDLMDRAYDYQSWTVSELAGLESVDYAIPVPANTIVYLMAYVDEDGDGQLNESGELVAAGDDETGRIPTGNQSQEVNLVLSTYEEVMQ